jgi:CelD/BcsL family acetyltransferase involved in cellulose biosynthesis
LANRSSRAELAAVQLVDPLVEPLWDEQVSAHPDVTLFHRAAWAAVLADTYGQKPVYLAIAPPGSLAAWLPVMEVDSRWTGRRGVALPFTDYLAPLASGPAAFAEVFHKALRVGRDRHWQSFECRGGAEWLSQAPPSLVFYRHALELTAKTDRLFSRFDSAVRRAVRKAERSQVTVEPSDTPDAIATYYALHCRTRRKHGLPPQPFAFFRNIQRHVIGRGAGRVFIARHGDRPVAGAVFLHSGKQAHYKFGASDASAQHLRPSNLVLWRAIQWHADQGFTTMDFGRTSVAHEGLRRFKLGWGATETTTAYLRYDLRKESFVTERDRADGWYNRVFSLMPLAALKWVGARVYPHLA